MRKFRLIFIIIGLMFSFSVGIYFGIRVNYKENLKSSNIRTELKDTIAVVNEDMGTYNNGSVKNYSEQIIDKMGDGFVLVSASAAQAGFDEGIYGSIVSFPTNLSKQVVSINSSRPEKVNLDFIINEHLPEDKYIQCYKRIIDLQYELNQTLSYMYVYSIYTEFHTGQDHIGSLFQNDKDDMSALEKVKLSNFTEQLELGDIPRPELNLDTLQFYEFVENVSGYAYSISDAYQDSYNQAVDDYSAYGDGLIDTTETLQDKSNEWDNNMTLWKNKILAYDSKVTEYKNSLVNWKSSADIWKTSNEKWYENLLKYKENLVEKRKVTDALVDEYNSYIANADEWQTKYDIWASPVITYGGDLQTSVDEFNKKVEDLNTYKKCLDDWNNSLESYNPLSDKDIPELELPKNFSIPATMDEIADLQAPSIDDYPVLTPETLNSYKINLIDPPEFSGDIELPEIVDEPVKENLEMPEKPEEIQYCLSDMSEKVYKYNPNNYLTSDIRDSISGYVTKYSDYVYEVKSMMDDTMSNNNQKLRDSYDYYNEYVKNLKEKSIACHEKEQQNLEDALNIFYTEKTNTSNENIELLGTLQTMMPESRINSVMNKNVVEFTVDPVIFVDASIRKPDETLSASDQLSLNLKNIMIGLFIASCIITIIMIIVYIKSKPKHEE